MSSCWQERPEQRPRFADIVSTITNTVLPTMASVASNNDTSSDGDIIAPCDDNDDEEQTDFLDCNEPLFSNESLFDSILNLLPNTHGSQEVEVDMHSRTEVATTPPSCPPTDDYYTEMITPLSRVVRKDKGCCNKANSKPANSNDRCKPNRDLTRAHSTQDHMMSTQLKSKGEGVSVSRNVSNCSDYCPMFAAQPAKPNCSK